MPLSLVQLETFRRLASLGNFTRTAEELFLSQSAVTQQMKQLAEHVGVPLFEVVSRRSVLTEAGAFLAERTADVLERIDALEREMADFSAARVGTLDLGATITIGNYVLPGLLAAFRREVPRVEFGLRIENTEAMLAAVASRRIALALVEGAVPDDDALTVTTFARDRLTLIVPATGHRFSERARISLEELADEPFVARETGSGTQTFALAILARGGVAMNVALTFPSNDGVVRAVEAGLGIALLSERAVERDVRSGTIAAVALDGADVERPLRAVRLLERRLSPLAARFLDFLVENGDRSAETALDNPEEVR